ncbi:MAG: hypothetical protein HHJ09_12570 [Glaciimonas sp.]|nr:hypothetical protein [Glaciimonas sp.]
MESLNRLMGAAAIDRRVIAVTKLSLTAHTTQTKATSHTIRRHQQGREQVSGVGILLC